MNLRPQLRSQIQASESTQLVRQGCFSSMILSQLQWPIEFKVSQLCYFMHMLRNIKWEGWSLTINSVVNVNRCFVLQKIPKSFNEISPNSMLIWTNTVRYNCTKQSHLQICLISDVCSLSIESRSVEMTNTSFDFMLSITVCFSYCHHLCHWFQTISLWWFGELSHEICMDNAQSSNPIFRWPLLIHEYVYLHCTSKQWRPWTSDFWLAYCACSIHNSFYVNFTNLF